MKNGFTISKALVGSPLALCLAIALTACATKDTNLALEVPLFGSSVAEPDAETMERIKQGDFGPDGLIFKAISDDEIYVNFSAVGDSASGETEKPVKITLKRNLWVFVVDSTVLVSLDGKNYQTPDKVFSGQLSAEFSLQKETRKNEIKIELTGNLKNQ